MPRLPALAFTSMLVLAALAGCTDGDETKPTPTPEVTPPTTTTPTSTTPVTTTPPVTPTPAVDSNSYKLAVGGAPTLVKVGETFGFTVYANGTGANRTDHVDAHLADNDTAPPTHNLTACVGGASALPAARVVNCTLAASGTWHVYGHMALTQDNVTLDYWASPLVVNARQLNLTLGPAPSTPQGSRSNFTLVLNGTGPLNFTSDHIDVHWFNASTTAPTVATAAGACAAATGGVVGNTTITCSIDSGAATPKEFFLYGHARLAGGDRTLEWWSNEQKVTIAPLGLGGLPGVP